MTSRDAVLWICVALGLIVWSEQSRAMELAAIASAQDLLLLTDDAIVESNGWYLKTVHVEIAVPNPASAAIVGQQAIFYADDSERVEVVEAYTRKADGRKVTVRSDAILTQATPADTGVRLLDDRRRKVIVFSDVGADDAVVYTYTRRSKQPYFEGHFWDMDAVPNASTVQQWRKSIRMPRGLALQVETHGMEFSKEEANEHTTYRWRYSASAAHATTAPILSQWDTSPRMFASTFKDYPEFAQAYSEIAASAMRVTPKIQTLAREITSGSDRRQHARQIYDWITTHIRFVAIELGRGAMFPRAADTVLDHRYGDCKDHAVLFSALLKAKAIDSDIVLVNTSNSYTLSGPPTLAQLNHAIVWIDEFKQYADTTLGVAPFGTLPFSEYGKPAVHLGARTEVLRRTPLVPGKDAMFFLRTISHISADGKLIGESETTATGPYLVMLRQIGNLIQALGPTRAAVEYFRKAGIAGAGVFDLESRSDLPSVYSIRGRFEVGPRPELYARAFPMPSGMRLLGFAGDGLMGPLFDRNVPSSEATPCYSGHAVEDLSVEAPPGKRFAKVPHDQTVQSDHIVFTARWSQFGRLMNVRREFRSTIGEPLCQEHVRESVARVLAQVAESFPTQLALVDD